MGGRKKSPLARTFSSGLVPPEGLGHVPRPRTGLQASAFSSSGQARRRLTRGRKKSPLTRTFLLDWCPRRDSVTCRDPAMACKPLPSRPSRKARRRFTRGRKKSPLARTFLLAWCPRRDSNPHTLRHMDLNHARLPIPPRGLKEGEIIAESVCKST